MRTIMPHYLLCFQKDSNGFELAHVTIPCFFNILVYNSASTPNLFLYRASCKLGRAGQQGRRMQSYMLVCHTVMCRANGLHTRATDWKKRFDQFRERCEVSANFNLEFIRRVAFCHGSSPTKLVNNGT